MTRYLDSDEILNGFHVAAIAMAFGDEWTPIQWTFFHGTCDALESICGVHPVQQGGGDFREWEWGKHDDVPF